MPTPRKRAHRHSRKPRAVSPAAGSRSSSPPPADPPVAPLELLEARLQEWFTTQPVTTSAPGRGRPPILPAMLLWAALLHCILHGFSSQLDLWRLITVAGLWHYPRVDISDLGVYQRLARTSVAEMEQFFRDITAGLATHLAGCKAVPGAAFAAGVYALDQTVLDPSRAKLKVFRGVPKGAHCLIPGVLGCVYDVRQQLWVKVAFNPNGMANEQPGAPDLVADLPTGSLVLFDQGFFSFPWLDRLVHQQLDFVCRLPDRITYQVVRPLGEVRTARVRLVESLVYLGAGTDANASHAAYPLRLIVVEEFTPGGALLRTRRYLTSVLDPRRLPAREAIALYARRWDIETAFDLCKSHLKLHLIWSAQQNVVLHQVYATLILAQIISGLRFEIAAKAQADVREVSVALLLRWLPQLAALGQDPIATFVAEGRRLGFIRPFRGLEYHVPAPTTNGYRIPKVFPPPRRARYSRHGPATPQRDLQDAINATLSCAK